MRILILAMTMMCLAVGCAVDDSGGDADCLYVVAQALTSGPGCPKCHSEGFVAAPIAEGHATEPAASGATTDPENGALPFYGCKCEGTDIVCLRCNMIGCWYENHGMSLYYCGCDYWDPDCSGYGD